MANRKKQLKEAQIDYKIQFYDASKILPQLQEIDPSKRIYQEMSKRCFVWVRWKEEKNRTYNNDPELRFGSMYKHGWSVDGMSGNIEVLQWAYIKPFKQ